MKQKEREIGILLKYQQAETDAVLIYRSLAIAAQDPADTALFHRLAADEGRHAAALKAITGKTLRPSKRMAARVTGLKRVLGREKTYRLVARFEYKAAAAYKPFCARYPALFGIRMDELRHGGEIYSLLSGASE